MRKQVAVNLQSEDALYDPNFNQLSLDSEIFMDITDTAYPTRVVSWNDRQTNLPEGDAHYGFVLSGSAKLKTPFGSFLLNKGMFFSVSDSASIIGGKGVVFARKNFQCPFNLGGPRDDQGQLQYIDGASTSVLIHPDVKGHPILNSLYLPPNTYQTMHVHPDIRLGLVFKGHGFCYTPDRQGRMGPDFEIGHELRAGSVFYIPTDGKHRFVTKDQSLVIVPWHAHTDAGVDDSSHYMLDRSIVKPGASGTESWLGKNTVFGHRLRDLA